MITIWWVLFVAGPSTVNLFQRVERWLMISSCAEVRVVNNECVNPSAFWGLVAYNPARLMIRVVIQRQLIR